MLNSKLNLKLVGIILAILFLGTIYFTEREYALTQKEIEKIQKETAVLETKTREIVQEKVTYIIDKGEGNVNFYQITLSRKSTVFSLLEELSKEKNFPIEFKTYEGMGIFVESIAGIKNGTDNKYWQYWVNGELPMVAADKKEVKKGDKVEWKFAPSPF